MCAVCQLPTSHVEEFVYVSNLLRNPYFLNYIDPGTGAVISSNLPAILGAVLGALGTAFLILRNRILPTFRKKWLIAIILLMIGVGAGIMFSMTKSKEVTSKKVIVLGFDGMDPKILEEGWSKKLFPNLKKLKDSGFYSKLQTVVPPQSPVAWASFITGEPPSKHSIYDFIERDPKDYSLNLVFSDQGLNRENRIKATPFWKKTSKKNIPTTVLFLPDTFEPPKTLTGEMISGMGVPDVLGTQGTFTIFTTRSYPTDNYTWRGKVIKIEKESLIKTNIEGPKYSALNETKISKIPLEIRNFGKDEAEIKVQSKTFKLKKGQFSDWLRLEFKIDFFTKVRGIAKFYLKSTSPEFELYLSPINFDPEAPVKPISTPLNFSAKLSRDLGLFTTLGLPHDTWALEENVFDERAFLTQAESILSERKKIYYSELSKFRNGIFVAYFGMPDTISHMFWRYLDDSNSPYRKTINEYYGKMDQIVGETVKKLDRDTTLFVLSDHGFSSFDYEMNVNTFLLENGFLVLKKGTTSGPLFESVDWSRTRAYVAGYNSVILNIKGREGQGIVEKKDVSVLEKEIISKLMDYKNPETHESVVKKVYTRADLGISDSDIYAPDMILGFYKGTRSSWDSAIGVVTDYTIRKRTSKWSGDHLFDATEVPGVLFTNKKLSVRDPKITDVMPAILKTFGINPD